MDTSAYARLGVFSTESAPGIIIAHGIPEHITMVYNMYSDLEHPSPTNAI